MNADLNPSRILETATAYWPSKILLTAVGRGLFTHLATAPRTNSEIAAALGFLPSRSPDFLDALVALGFLERVGNGDSAKYSNAPEPDLFLDRNKPSYMGGLLEMMNARLFGFWDGLGEALETGEPQNEAKNNGSPIFEAIYASEEKTTEFLNAMAGMQAGNFMALAQKFDFSKFASVVDVGGANGTLCRTLAKQYPELALTLFDLPQVAPIARRENEAAGMSSRIQVESGDFFSDPLPGADVIVMGNVLHDWNEAQKQELIAKAYGALPEGGVFIAVEAIIDDERRNNAFGLFMSLNMLIETGAEGGFDYTGAQFDGWCRGAGFQRTEVMPLVGPTSAAIAYK